MPRIAGSRRSFLVSVMLKWKGLAVWITASRPSILRASSKALGTAMSSTIRKSSFEEGVFGWAALILSALDWERTEVITSWPCSRRMSRMWAAMKPDPPENDCQYNIKDAIGNWKLGSTKLCTTDGMSMVGEWDAG